ncbi:hypothetical protein LTR56_023584 [Elasticomyces elasticus]|nr:hypothetical protein LTR56_023584 [Elasticomyces elasticus]KAK3624109.1 hypothetical protein LTR22_024124 [Elasticomyces elasticus]KAK4908635.1 hypothetical protein LTR49_022499 [Elasticomyces elasticus]KAK5733786.1 hypothetical protein LTS12_026866 [Elasticomyces elasticus]
MESWYHSFYSVFAPAAASRINPWVAWADPNFVGKLWWIASKGIAKGQLRADDAKEFAIHARGRQVAGVQVGGGLGAFVRVPGTEEPVVPFPRVRAHVKSETGAWYADKPTSQANEVEIMEEKLRLLIAISLRRAGAKARNFVVTAAVVAIAFWWAWSACAHLSDPQG